MNALRIIVAILFYFLCNSNVYAQQVPLRNYTMRDGLSHSNVFRIMQDEHGFMLFATSYGLSIFDSKNFHNYTKKEGLPHNTVISLAPYSKNQKLICTYGGGLGLMNDSSITKFPIKRGKMPANVVSAAEFGNAIWLVGLDSVYRLFCVRNGIIEKILVKDNNGRQAIFNKTILTRGKLLLATDIGVFSVEKNGNIIHLWQSVMESMTIDVQQTEDESYWIGLKDCLLQLKDNKIVKRFPLVDKATISDLLADSKGNVWIATVGDGLYCVQKERLIHFSEYMNIPKVIINDLYEDVDGSLWIASHGKGIYRMDGMQTINFVPENGNINAYCKALISLNDSTIIAGSIGTLSQYQKGKLKALSSQNIKAADYIYFIKKRKQQLIIGTPRNLIAKNIAPPYNEKIIQYHKTIAGCISYFEDSHGDVWAGSFGQLYKVQNDTLLTIEQPLLRHNRFNTIEEDAAGNVCFGTDSGLVVKTGNRYERVYIPGVPLNTTVNDIHRDTRGRVWIATNEGLFLKQDDKIKSFSTGDGLTHGKCNTISEDSARMLWIGTINGMSCINLVNLHVRDYRSQIYPNEVLAVLPFHHALFVGLVDGLSILENPASGKEEPPPPLYITSLHTGTKGISVTEKINLSYWDNKLSIDFIAVSYRNADLVNYRYKIAGQDNDWHYTSGNTIVLSALPHGSYTLLLSARQNSGKWSVSKSLEIHVSKPFWKEWWFVSLSILFVLSMVFFVARWVAVRREKQKTQQLSVYNKIVYLKQQALTALINPHFIFNCMNSIQHYLNRNDNDKANEYLADFAALIRITMEQAQQAFISLDEEIERLRLYLALEQLRFGAHLKYDINIDPSLNLLQTRIPNMILQPYIENAIWHGIMPKKSFGFVAINFRKYSDAEIEIVIEDDGVGIKKQKKEGLRNPLGMRLTEERLQMLSELLHQYYHVTVANKNDNIDKITGTIVTLRLPIKPNEEMLHSKEQALNQ